MKLISLIYLVLFILSGCGADPLKKDALSSSSALAAQCSCRRDNMPVCDINGKTHENICMAKCVGVTQTSQGHCQCDPTLKVCGEDWVTYNECDAIQFRVKIVKFVACNVQPL